MQEFSLASFADTNTDDIVALDSLVPPAGAFGVRVSGAALGENEKKEGIDPNTGMPYLPLFFAAYKYEILSADPLDKNVDGEKLKGRVLNDRFTFWPTQMQEYIGLLKGRYRKAGIATDGRMGGVEGGEPGWIDGAVDQIIGLKIRHGKNADGSPRAYFDWFNLNEEEAAA